jgi:hypothetical protein
MHSFCQSCIIEAVVVHGGHTPRCPVCMTEGCKDANMYHDNKVVVFNFLPQEKATN